MMRIIMKGSVTVKVVIKKPNYPIHNGMENTIKHLKDRGLLT